jgi:hypothetical protein
MTKKDKTVDVVKNDVDKGKVESPKNSIISTGSMKLLRTLTRLDTSISLRAKPDRTKKMNKKKAKEADQLIIDNPALLTYPEEVGKERATPDSIAGILHNTHGDMRSFLNNETIKGYKVTSDNLTIFLNNKIRLVITPLQPKYNSGFRNWEQNGKTIKVPIKNLSIAKDRYQYTLIGKIKNKDKVIFDITDLPVADIKV